nr:MAG TPA: hypothetical protein [Caudoviricetes sp.]
MSSLDIAHEPQGQLGQLSSKLTPKDTGHLRGSYAVGDITRRDGEYVIKVYMPTFTRDTV